MGGKKPLRRPLWPPTRATASNYYPLGLDGAGGAAKPLLRAPKKPAPLHGRLPAFSGAVDAFERARKCFLEWRYFFSIILSEFLKNRVALQYLTEYAANKRVVAVIEYAAETLSGIPSIIYGLVGQMFFCQFLGMKKSLLAGAMTLVIMNLPTIMRTTQESLKTVPQSYREGAFGLGAGKWRTIRTVVLPGCVDGVLTGCILAVGRILGETAALLYTAGFAHTLYNSLRATLEGSGATLSVALYVYAKEQGEFDVAFAIAAILMALALLINLAAMLTGRYFKKRRSL